MNDLSLKSNKIMLIEGEKVKCDNQQYQNTNMKSQF